MHYKHYILNMINKTIIGKKKAVEENDYNCINLINRLISKNRFFIKLRMNKE